MSDQTLVFACGNPLLDIAAHFDDDELIKKYNLVYGGASLADESHKELFETLMKTEGMETMPGGSAMNTIRCTNFLLKQKALPNSCLYFGAICDDDVGALLKKGVEEENLTANFDKPEDSYTGKCAVVVHERERALCADLGACMKYNTEHMVANIEQAKDSKVIYTTGFFVTSNFEALMTAAKYANENGKHFAINISAAFIIQFHKDQVTEMIKYADYVFGNEEEFKVFGETFGFESESLLDVTKQLSQMEKIDSSKPRTVITTQGKEPTLYALHNFETKETETKEVPVELISADQIVDLNGAGDAFVGGFLAELAQDKPVEECIKAGMWMSSYIIQQPGTTFTSDAKYYN